MQISREKTAEFLLAPLAEYTDIPFRMACRAQGARRCYTPLIDAGALSHGNPNNELILARDPREDWLGVQLLGSIPEHLEISAKMLLERDYDAFDFNMGCPMQKVIKRPAGAALVFPENQSLALQCVRLLRKIWKDKIFTIKMRILDFEDPEPTVAFAKELEQCGIDGLTLHGRVQKVIYSGPVAFHVIRAVREALKIPVVANGGVFDVASAKELAEKTGCSALMIARGAIGNPWIFKSLQTGIDYTPGHEELCNTLEAHINGMIAFYPRPFPIVRKVIVSYLKGRGYGKQLRERGALVKDLDDFQNLMKSLRAYTPTHPIS